MASAVFPILFLSIFLSLSASKGNESPIQDYCIPDAGAGDGGAAPLSSSLLPSYPCKNPSNLTTADFVYRNIKTPPPPASFSPSLAFAGTPVTKLQFPALHTLGHVFRAVRPRVRGLRGLRRPDIRDGAGEGEVMVLPKGMVHFQMNVSDDPAAIVGFFDSENPGVVTLFGSGVADGLLEKAFSVDEKELGRLRKNFNKPKPTNPKI